MALKNCLNVPACVQIEIERKNPYENVWCVRFLLRLNSKFVVQNGKWWVSFERFIGTKAVHLLQSNFYLVKAAAATAATATAVVIAVAVAVVMTVNGVTIIIVALLTYFQLPHPEAFLQHFSILIKSFFAFDRVVESVAIYPCIW